MLNLKFKENYGGRENRFRSNVGNGKSFITVERAAIYFANLGEGKGSIQGSIRPVIVCSNFKCNENSPVVTVIPLTSQLHKRPLPTHVTINKECGLEYDSTALVEQIMPLNKTDLISYVGRCTEEEMERIEKAIQIQNGIKVRKEVTEEIFNITKVMDIVNSIQELDEFINKWDNPQLKPIKRSRKTLLDQLYDYCNKFNKNISLFYKDITSNNNQNYRGRTAINA